MCKLLFFYKLNELMLFGWGGTFRSFQVVKLLIERMPFLCPIALLCVFCVVVCGAASFFIHRYVGDSSGLSIYKITFLVIDMTVNKLS